MQLIIPIVVVVVALHARRQRGIVIGTGHFHIVIGSIFSVFQLDSDAFRGTQRLVGDLRKMGKRKREL